MAGSNQKYMHRVNALSSEISIAPAEVANVDTTVTNYCVQIKHESLLMREVNPSTPLSMDIDSDLRLTNRMNLLKLKTTCSISFKGLRRYHTMRSQVASSS